MPQVLKRVEVPQSILTELDWESGGYLLRYRLVAENRNKRSHWSPVYFIPVGAFSKVVGEYSEVASDSDITKKIVNVVWDDLYNRPLYDIFVAFDYNQPANTFEYDGENFYYHGTSSVHTYSFVQRDLNTAESIRIIVQPAANKKIIKSDFIIYDSANPVVEES